MSAIVRLRRALSSFSSYFYTASSPDTLHITPSFDSEFGQYPSADPIARDSIATTLGRHADMQKDRTVVKLVLQFVVLCVVSLVPVGIAALGLTFSHPSTAVLVSVYVVTGAISLTGATASSVYTYRRINRLVDGRQHQLPFAGQESQTSQVTRVTSALDAFSATQRWYLPEHMHTTPTLVPRSQLYAVERSLSPLPSSNRPSLEATRGSTLAYQSSGYLPGLIRVQPLYKPDPVHVKSAARVKYIPLKTIHSSDSSIGLPPVVSVFASQPLAASNNLDRYSASTTCIDGMRKSLEADGLHETTDDTSGLVNDDDDDENEDDESDAGSARIYDFDEVKIKSTCSLDGALLALRPHSSSTIVVPPPRCTSCMRTHSEYRKEEHSAFVREIAHLNAVVVQSSRPKIVNADQLYQTSPSAFSSTGYSTPAFPEPPPGPAMRLQYHAMPPISAVLMSTCDLQLPLRYTKQGVSQGSTRSIYGERSAAESMAVEDYSLDHLAASQFSRPEVPRPQPTWIEPSEPVYGRLAVPEGIDVNQIVGKLQYIVSCQSSDTSQTTSVSSAEMKGLDEPMLESSGLGWRRNTMSKIRERKIESSSSEDGPGSEVFDISGSDGSLPDVYYASAVSHPAVPLRSSTGSSSDVQSHVSLCSDYSQAPPRSTSLTTGVNLDWQTTVQLFHRPDISLGDSAANLPAHCTLINLGVSEIKLVPHRVEQATVSLSSNQGSAAGNNTTLACSDMCEISERSSLAIDDDSVVLVQVA
ncbi:hypothetical protein DL89DRAFT_270504 [Linderina pennispora]|uniref:Transmembrane protein n=1 Tax=Linderina pennispora TaxID=61395 RepID=A0A1Y1VY70_9FUNG|nr:uncharacterized protein DL89DRAFT_270504 [Linderina pennispora]ORX65956.1 hypothetical protein DL89DRAFT_270504 [Linderina pennispora]